MKNSNIIYHVNLKPTLNDAIALYSRCSLGERRPIQDRTRFEAMLNNANLIITAWDNNRLVGIARCITDFVYTTYLSDLAVDEDYQRMEIGKQLIKKVQKNTDKQCTIVLLAAPQAVNYYPHIGFEPHQSAWILSQPLK